MASCRWRPAVRGRGWWADSTGVRPAMPVPGEEQVVAHRAPTDVMPASQSEDTDLHPAGQVCRVRSGQLSRVGGTHLVRSSTMSRRP